jgi:hypothetical protein
MKRLIPVAIAFLITSTFAFIACNKDHSTYRLNVKLTDAPADYEEVNVDIQEVKVKLRNDSSSWIGLTTNAGIYNLLGLQNGVDTFLATGTLPGNYVQELRLYLGPNNSIKVSGQTYPLLTDNGTQIKLMIKVNKVISKSLDSLTVDFDANLSVVDEGNGSYRLSPVITIKE